MTPGPAQGAPLAPGPGGRKGLRGPKEADQGPAARALAAPQPLPVADARSTDTPGPIVEATDTFFM